MPSPSFIDRAERFRDQPALIELDRTTYTYSDLLNQSAMVAGVLLHDRSDLAGQRIAFLVDPSATYVVVQWAIWRAGGIAVPLATMHPTAELAHVIRDCDPELIVAQPHYVQRVADIAKDQGVGVVVTDAFTDSPIRPLPDVSDSRPALIVYTSGSTGKPKGVVTTHANIKAQIVSLTEAWEWSPQDRILLTLPLHHVHGIINVVGCCLWSGATCHIHPRFDASLVWQAFVDENLTLFMAVPTIYKRLIDFWDAADADDQEKMSHACTKLRLMVSGSAALPQSTLETWKHISHHTLLERYGMTEIGMALANPLHGDRRPGYVGTPLPMVDVKIVDDDGTTVSPGHQGEIFVRGPLVFSEYWRRPDETENAFDGNWFKTGDIAVVEDGYYRIVGRRNVDIIKTGGYKISALEIEEVLRTHPSVEECAVVGVPDSEWGQRVAVAIEATGNFDVATLKDWARPRLAPYKIPTAARIVKSLPRNAMGKVVKAEVAQLFRETI